MVKKTIVGDNITSINNLLYDIDFGGFDENKAMDLLIKKRNNKKKTDLSKKNSRYKRVNDSSEYRNNSRNFQYDYEEDFYEPK